MDFSTSRSSGPGGQNVNKRDTKVTFKWDYRNSDKLSPEQKEAISNHKPLQKLTNKEGVIVIQESRTREQHRNRFFAIKKLNEHVKEALRPEVERTKKGIPGRKEEKLANKSRRASKKRSRSRNKIR